MASTKPAAAMTANPEGLDKPSSAGKAVGYSSEDAPPPAVACAETSMGGYQDVAGLEDRIRTLAYRLWEMADRPEGQDGDFWHQAEQMV